MAFSITFWADFGNYAYLSESDSVQKYLPKLHYLALGPRMAV